MGNGPVIAVAEMLLGEKRHRLDHSRLQTLLPKGIPNSLVRDVNVGVVSEEVDHIYSSVAASRDNKSLGVSAVILRKLLRTSTLGLFNTWAMFGDDPGYSGTASTSSCFDLGVQFAVVKVVEDVRNSVGTELAHGGYLSAT